MATEAEIKKRIEALTAEAELQQQIFQRYGTSQLMIREEPLPYKNLEIKWKRFLNLKTK